ncbi:MAG: STAS domain-containing protein [Magnetococcales bacterium]|nr:STAS domain-containing protein [Magnetococcales bacterium]NGZ28280.1 STAS domain-containing protein [Magnetococcales bacterium]
MIEYTLDEGGAAAVLKFSGPANISQAQKLHATLLELVGKVQHLTLQFSDTNSADLSVLQLLCSAHRHLHRGGGSLTLRGPLPAALRDAILTAGFTNCVGENDKSGLWIGEAS